jgi:hypothetical protein
VLASWISRRLRRFVVVALVAGIGTTAPLLDASPASATQYICAGYGVSTQSMPQPQGPCAEAPWPLDTECWWAAYYDQGQPASIYASAMVCYPQDVYWPL